MKIQQIIILYAKECLGTYYSFRQYINESIRNMSRQKDISQVRVISVTDQTCVLAYLLDLPEDEI